MMTETQIQELKFAVRLHSLMIQTIKEMLRIKGITTPEEFDRLMLELRKSNFDQMYKFKEDRPTHTPEGLFILEDLDNEP